LWEKNTVSWLISHANKFKGTLVFCVRHPMYDWFSTLGFAMPENIQHKPSTWRNHENLLKHILEFSKNWKLYTSIVHLQMYIVENFEIQTQSIKIHTKIKNLWCIWIRRQILRNLPSSCICTRKLLFSYDFFYKTSLNL